MILWIGSDSLLCGVVSEVGAFPPVMTRKQRACEFVFSGGWQNGLAAWKLDLIMEDSGCYAASKK